VAVDRYLAWRLTLTRLGWPPRTRVGKVAFLVLGLDAALFTVDKLMLWTRVSSRPTLSGWVTFLTFASFVLFSWLAFRWLRREVLWRLRNRLIVSYILIGVIPVILLLTLSLTAFYLFAGQFATFVVTSGVEAELKTLHAANSAIAHELSVQLARGSLSQSAELEDLHKSDANWAQRQVTAWAGGRVIFNAVPAGSHAEPMAVPNFLKLPFEGVVRDKGKLHLRCMDRIAGSQTPITVVSGEPFEQNLLEQLANNLGEITLYTSGFRVRNLDQSDKSQETESAAPRAKRESGYVLDTGNQPILPSYTAGTLPLAQSALDRKVMFATSIFVVDWHNGDSNSPAAVRVETRVSMLYSRLFAALGNFAPAVEFLLVAMAIVFAVIEIFALLIGLGLSRTITRSIANLYRATQRINRGDFAHRIQVTTDDQLAALENSFNSMTASLERLLAEQKEKQRLENELVIAQEVQAQLFPKEISQLESLEVHGFCRPARTVSGDYYDFLGLNTRKLMLAVGDISGKGISAALLMATIHSAVRAYSLESIPAEGLPVAVGAGAAPGAMRRAGQLANEISPGALLALLNHQLYESTPSEKYATLFLGLYDGRSRSLTYSNGGHLPPVIVRNDGSTARLQAGGMVVGLFDHQVFDEGTIQLKAGDIFLAYSDGVTEPENDFGEFGEQRLIDLVRENQHLSLLRISDIVSTAVNDWIGANEQPDDITLVLARAR